MPRHTPYEPGAVDPQGPRPASGITIVSIILGAVLLLATGYLLFGASAPTTSTSQQVQSAPR